MTKFTWADYPLYKPPLFVAEKKPTEWSRSEADTYFAWVLQNMAPRVECFLYFTGLNGIDDAPTLLVDVQSKLEELLPQALFSEAKATAGTGLTRLGNSVAADAGLLLADRILKAAGQKVHWMVVRRPKRDVAYNLPVLTWGDGEYFDPIGLSVGRAVGIVNGRCRKNAWLRAYEYVLNGLDPQN